MNRTIATAGLIVLLGLGACTAAQVSSDVSQAQQACVTVQPVLTAAAASTNSTAQQIASYGNALCGPLALGSVPPTVNASTPAWLGTLAGMIQTILPLAVGLL